MQDAKLSAPSALRNRTLIRDVLRDHLPTHGVVLEVASGTGEHVVHFATGLPGLVFQPSDIDADRRASIDAWVAEAVDAADRIRPAIAVDATQHWSSTALGGPFDAVICINMIHIAPWAATLGLLAGAAQVLEPDGHLVLYGPFRRNGAHTAPSNAAFDDDLRGRNPDWGIRDLEAVTAEAVEQGFAFPVVIDMPANNVTLIFRRISHLPKKDPDVAAPVHVSS